MHPASCADRVDKAIYYRNMRKTISYQTGNKIAHLERRDRTGSINFQYIIKPRPEISFYM